MFGKSVREARSNSWGMQWGLWGQWGLCDHPAICQCNLAQSPVLSSVIIKLLPVLSSSINCQFLQENNLELRQHPLQWTVMVSSSLQVLTSHSDHERLRDIFNPSWSPAVISMFWFCNYHWAGLGWPELPKINNNWSNGMPLTAKLMTSSEETVVHL